MIKHLISFNSAKLSDYTFTGEECAVPCETLAQVVPQRNIRCFGGIG